MLIRGLSRGLFRGLFLPLFWALLLGGCRATILKPTEADESRREAQQLRLEVAELNLRIAHLEAEADLLRRSSSGRGGVSLEHLPIPVRLDLGRFSGPVWPKGGQPARIVRLYLRPVDGLGRLVHPLGPLTVDVFSWTVEGQPRPIGNAHLSVGDLADRYRSGPTGTHYTVEIELESALDVGSDLLVRCRLAGAVSGHEITVERGFPATPGAH